jgi:NitT/TauT family transport system substrate-binding protein
LGIHLLSSLEETEYPEPHESQIKSQVTKEINMYHIKNLGFVVLTILVAMTLPACGSKAATQALTPITIQLKWLHQAQFAGLYAADQNGYYAAEGLKVSFIEGGATVDLEKSVLDGTAQFGDIGADTLITARADGKPLRAIAVIYRRSPLVFMALANSGITRPQDFVGKTIQADTGAITLHAMLAKVGISSDQYHEVNIGTDLEPFYSGQVQVWNAFINNEVLTAQSEGYKVNLIYPDDYGIHFYSDTLYATDNYIAANPDLVLRFLRATLKGWTYAIENPNLVAPMVSKYNPSANLQHETAQMIASIPLINTGEDYIGWMKPEIWAGMEQVLREQGVITRSLDVTQAYTMQFLEKIYK